MGKSQPQTSTVTQSVPPEAKPYLYGDANNAGILERARALSEQPLNLPNYQVAGFSQPQINAFNLAQSGIGGYMPALTQGSSAIRQGIGAATQGLGMAQSAISGAMPYRGKAESAASSAVSAANPLFKTAAGNVESSLDASMPYRTKAETMAGRATNLYDPTTAYQGYMNPYIEDVVRQAERDITRLGDIQSQGIRAQAVGGGAFGGSRQAVAEQELGRNLADQYSRTTSDLRARGFEQAQSQAQQSFEQQQQREAQMAALMGNLGTAYGQLGLQGANQLANIASSQGQLGMQQAGLLGDLGTAYGQLGLQGAGQAAAMAQGLGSLGAQMANVGALGQQMNLADVNALMSIGTAQQAQQQAVLDAQRQNQYQQVMSPYQQLGFFSDIFQGMPVGGITQSTQPGPSAISQIGGLAYGIGSLAGALR